MKGYGAIKVDGKNKKAHRVSYEMYVGEPIANGLLIDHICHEPRCVRPEHLRVATHKLNVENHDGTALSNNQTSRVRGVDWDARKKRWRARVMHNGKRYRKSFRTIPEAAEWVREMRCALHTFNDVDREAA